MRRNSNAVIRRSGNPPKAAKKQANQLRVVGMSVVNFSTNASNTGIFINDANDIDTSLFGNISTLSTVFEQWKINSIKFEYVPNVGSTTVGTVYMACTDDPNESAPVSTASILNMRTAVCTQCWSKASINYVPLGGRWYFTRDQLTSDDRLEMPGVFELATDSFATSVSPGRVLVHYDLEFRGISNATINTLTTTGPVPTGFKISRVSRC